MVGCVEKETPHRVWNSAQKEKVRGKQKIASVLLTATTTIFSNDNKRTTWTHRSR
jgi:hypothetical protein